MTVLLLLLMMMIRGRIDTDIADAPFDAATHLFLEARRCSAAES